MCLKAALFLIFKPVMQTILSPNKQVSSYFLTLPNLHLQYHNNGISIHAVIQVIN